MRWTALLRDCRGFALSAADPPARGQEGPRSRPSPTACGLVSEGGHGSWDTNNAQKARLFQDERVRLGDRFVPRICAA